MGKLTQFAFVAGGLAGLAGGPKGVEALPGAVTEFMGRQPVLEEIGEYPHLVAAAQDLETAHAGEGLIVVVDPADTIGHLEPIGVLHPNEEVVLGAQGGWTDPKVLRGRNGQTAATTRLPLGVVRQRIDNETEHSEKVIRPVAAFLGAIGLGALGRKLKKAGQTGHGGGGH